MVCAGGFSAVVVHVHYRLRSGSLQASRLKRVLAPRCHFCTPVIKMLRFVNLLLSKLIFFHSAKSHHHIFFLGNPLTEQPKGCHYQDSPCVAPIAANVVSAAPTDWWLVLDKGYSLHLHAWSSFKQGHGYNLFLIQLHPFAVGNEIRGYRPHQSINVTQPVLAPLLFLSLDP